VLLASLAGVAQAAPPVFDNWSVTNGNINVPCAAGFTCSVLTSGAGFMQVQWVSQSTGINDPSVTYIQTIVTDANADGPLAGLAYVDESFVQLGGNNGIMGQQRQASTDATGTFSSTSNLNIGWANTVAGSPTMTISQSFTSPGGAALGDEFSNSFTMDLIGSDVDPDGSNRNRRINIDQNVGMGDGVTASTDLQRFVVVGTRGSFTQAGGSLTLGPADGSNFPQSNTNNPTLPTGGTVNWAAGDDVMVRWLGQTLALPGQGNSVFGFQGIVNNSGTSTTPTNEVTTFSTSSTGITPNGSGGYVQPFSWNAAFGTAPTIP
jgi:hypothetical protein